MISDPSKIKPGQIRCGEHTDYGGITLLIQDDVGGLEVRNQLRTLFLVLSFYLFNTSCVRIILTLLQYCLFLGQYRLITCNKRLIQVTNVDGQFVPAKPMKGAVLVNIDDLMQRWTSDRYKSVVSLNTNKN